MSFYHANTTSLAMYKRMISLDKYRRLLNGVEVIPAVEFLHDLWSGRIITP